MSDALAHGVPATATYPSPHPCPPDDDRRATDPEEDATASTNDTADVATADVAAMGATASPAEEEKVLPFPVGDPDKVRELGAPDHKIEQWTLPNEKQSYF